jgi:hypothetical protein
LITAVRHLYMVRGEQKTLIMSGSVDKRPRLVANPVKQNMPVVADIELPFED